MLFISVISKNIVSVFVSKFRSVWSQIVSQRKKNVVNFMFKEKKKCRRLSVYRKRKKKLSQTIFLS